DHHHADRGGGLGPHRPGDAVGLDQLPRRHAALRASTMDAPIKSYCDVAPGHPFHGPYHEAEYGFPLKTDDPVFERLALEINQAGLSWLTILKKREGFRRAYDGFAIDRVARYGDKQRERLLADAEIIRNRLKVDAAIENAKRIQALQREFGSFAAWLASHH